MTELDLVLRAAEAGDGDGDGYVFFMLNRSVAVVRYDRASLWRAGARPSLLGVSGVGEPGERSTFAASWGALLAGLKDHAAAGPLFRGRVAAAADWDAKTAETDGLAALWLPLPGRDAALLVERWGGDDFSLDETESLARLARAYALAWPDPRRRARPPGRRRRWLLALAAVAALLVLVRLPLRVVAPCEVTARRPHLVSAPMDGVIDEVLVAPGQRVEAGQPLARYDARLMEEELTVARRQMEVVEAELSAARARGFQDQRYRAEIALLEARLEQEAARRDALEARFARRVVTAARDGLVQLDDARAWRGRPVGTGQAILWLVDPADSRLTVWMPQDDRIEVDAERPIHVHLHALGGAARRARLTYVSSFAQPTTEGTYAFPAEAEWLDDAPPPPLGLRGTASLYGEKTSLGRWLFRRPAAWLRRWLGV